MKKIACFILIGAFFSFMAVPASYAFDVKSGAEAVKSASNALGGGTSETKKTEITNSNINNDVKVKNSLVVGNSGVSIKGEKIKISNSNINNKVKVKNSAVIGNSGVSVGN